MKPPAWLAAARRTPHAGIVAVIVSDQHPPLSPFGPDPPANLEKLKRVSQKLLDTLKAEKLRMDSWREKEATRADVRAFIFDFLYDEQDGLPADDYTDEEVAVRTSLVFEHIYQQYPDLEHSVYQVQ